MIHLNYNDIYHIWTKEQGQHQRSTYNVFVQFYCVIITHFVKKKK